MIDPKLQKAMESKDKWLETLKWIQTRPIEHENITFGEILLWFALGDEETRVLSRTKWRSILG